MSIEPATATSQSNFMSIFDAALENYKRKTKNDLASHPLLPILQSCDSPDAVLTVLREQIPAFSQSQNDDEGLTKWVTPTVNVLYAFSATLGQGVGLSFPPANAIFAGIGVLLLAAKDASSRQDKLIDVFNRIKRFFYRLEVYTDIRPTMAMTDIIIEIMVEVLTILAIATKEVKCGGLKKYFKKMTGNLDVEDSLERLDKLTQEEARMASAELLRMMRSIDGKVMGVDDRVKGIEGKIQDVYSDVHDVGNKVEGVDDNSDQVKRNQLRDSHFRWLSPSDPSINHDIACNARYNVTAQWFVQGSVFNQWKSTGSFLWVHGKPGSGKSILCSSIIQDVIALRDAGRASMAYFYFDSGDVDKRKLGDLLPSLLIQLSALSDPCRNILSRLYSLHDCGGRKPSNRAMVECLKEMLAVEPQGPTYIILDALNECPITSTIPSPREEVLEFVDELVGLHLSNVHMCVTSRPEHDIQAVLKDLTLRTISLHDESGQQEDIANYVASFVYSDQNMQRWREEDKNLVIKTLSEKAYGMFLWVFCQLEVLRHCSPSSARRILEEFPESLYETYERMLKEIREPHQEYAHRLLQCLVVAVRPLRVEELVEVLAVDFTAEGIPRLNLGRLLEDQEKAVMSACSSLVMIVKDGDSRVVQFSHSSVKQFLTAEWLAEPIRDVSRYPIRLEPAHTILAQACLGVLLRLDDRVDRDNTENFPLARYAAEHWPTHARFANASLWIKDAMKCLFDATKPHFAAWLWIYNEDHWATGCSMSTMCPEEPEAVPLYYAARLGFRDLAEHLIDEHPEHVNARGGWEFTPMHVAARAGHANILSLLLEHGADAEGPGMNGQSPLHLTSAGGKLEAGRCLLDRGADINFRIENDWTPLFRAVHQGHIEFARMLLDRGARINARDVPNSWTPLHWAVVSGDIQAVRLLLEHGADVNASGKLGITPSSLASQRGISELLDQYGAKCF